MALKTSRQSSIQTGVENGPIHKTRRQSTVLPLASQRSALNEIGNIVRQQNLRASICVEMSKENSGVSSKIRVRRSTRLSVAAQSNANQPWKAPQVPGGPKQTLDKAAAKPTTKVPKVAPTAVKSALYRDSARPECKSVIRAPRLTMKPPPVETPPEERMAAQRLIRQSLAADRDRQLAASIQKDETGLEKSSHERKERDNPTEDDIDLPHQQIFWMVTTYSKNIFSYLQELDRQETLKMKQQLKSVTVTTRTKLVEYMASAYLQLHLLQETFQLGVSILDRYLVQAVDIKETKLELVALTCLSLGIKYEELLTSLVRELLSRSTRSYSLKEFIEMEAEVMTVLNFQVARPIPLVFLRRYNTVVHCERMQHGYGKYLIDLAQLDLALVRLPASSLAAAAVFIGITLINLRVDPEIWSPRLLYYTALSFDDIKPVVSRMATLVLPGGPRCRSLRRKYVAEVFNLSTDRAQKLLVALRDLANS